MRSIKISYLQQSEHNEFYLTNRFLVAVRLFSNTSQMTSKCGKNKKVAHEAIAERVTDVLLIINLCYLRADSRKYRE